MVTKLGNLGLRYERRSRADLAVVADDQDVFATEQCRQFGHVRLGRFVNDDKIQHAEVGWELLGHAPSWHDPAGNSVVTPCHGIARGTPVLPGCFARALANSREGTDEFD